MGKKCVSKCQNPLNNMNLKVRNLDKASKLNVCLVPLIFPQCTDHPPLPQAHPRQGGVQGGHVGPRPRESHRPVSREAILQRPELGPVLPDDKIVNYTKYYRVPKKKKI